MTGTPAHRLLIVIQVVVLLVAALYFAQPVLLPVVTAVLLTFLLRPPAVWLERQKVPRVAAVGAIVAAIALGFAGIGWVVTHQLHGLALHLDEYRGHMRTKVAWLRDRPSEAFENVREIVREVTDTIEGEQAASPDATDAPLSDAANVEMARRDENGELFKGPSAVLPTVNRPSNGQVASGGAYDSALFMLQWAWKLISTPLATAAVTTVLVIFMLIEFEELRNRLLRLAGQTKLTLTTRTLDDVSRRISRYLLANALVNGGFGVAVFLGLRLLGVDYAALWGFLAAVLRFVPYVGPIVAACLPVSMAIIQFPDWTHPVLVVALFGMLELVTNNVVEPLAYGKTAGVSTVALLIAATFWAWLWGPMGLVLSVPLTVVLAVVGQHVPQLAILGVLLGDKPALSTHETFYQRLLAGDADEAAELLEDALGAQERAVVYDELVVPALALAERDRQHGDLNEADRRFVWQNAQALIEANEPPVVVLAPERIRIAACPAQDDADELVLTLLHHLSSPQAELRVLGTKLMVSEKIAALKAPLPDATLISTVGSGGGSQVRYLCKRIRQEFPRMRLFVAHWNYLGDRERLTTRLKAVGVDQVVVTLQEAVDLIQRIQPVAEPVAPMAPTGDLAERVTARLPA